MKHTASVLVVFRHTVTVAGLGQKQCGVDVCREGSRYGVEAGKNSQISAGHEGWGWFKFYGLGAGKIS